MKLDVFVRDAKPEDREDIVRIWYESASLPEAGFASVPPLPEFRAHAEEDLSDGCSLTVAIASQAIVGFVACRPHDRVLSELFVSPAHLRRGIGRALLSKAKSLMPNGFTLTTRAVNARARRFYEAEGLSIVRFDLHPVAKERVVIYEWVA